MQIPRLLPSRDSLSLDQGANYPVREQVLVLNAQLRVLAASRSFYNAFQLSASTVIGKDLVELGDGLWNMPALLTLLDNLPSTQGESEGLEVEQHLPALGRRTILLSGQRLPGQDAESELILLRMRDTTELKRGFAQAAEMLTQSQVSLSTIGYALIVTDQQNRIKFMNSTAEKLTGWAQNDAWQKQLKDVFNIVRERSGTTLESPVERAIRQRGIVDLDKYTVLMSRHGEACPISGDATQILDTFGQLAGAILVFHDISFRRKAEQAMEVSEMRYRRLFESAHDGIMILDAVTARVLDVNPFLVNLLGYPKEYFLGKELWEIGVLQDAETSKQVMETLQRHGRIRYEDLPLQHKDGRHIPVEFVSNVYPEGERSVIQCNIRDITERQRLAQALSKATRDAEAANRSKSEFLANMSHEIRTPMGAILGFADMLLHRSPEECAQVGCVQIIHRNALHLLELINDILDLSKVEAGQMMVERISCDLPELLSEMIALMRPRAAEKGLAFGITFQGSIPRVIQSDPLRLRQILVNLLGNAVKFTESGRIDLRIADAGLGTPDITLRISVVDTGIGMTTEQLGRLFKPFTQADASVTRKFGGTGLGLTISRQLAHLLRGEVVVTSQAGFGSTFTLTVDGGPSAGVERLPDLTEASLPIKIEQEAQTQIRLHGQILLVDDGADNQRLLGMQLGDAGAAVISALDGQSAVDIATTQPFDLILMDMQMPIMDGYAATLELRRRGISIPIIAVTAYAMAEDRAKCLASGCTAYLTKPMQEELLLRTVSEYLEQDKIPQPMPPTATHKTGPSAPAVVQPGPINASNRIRSSHVGNARIMAIVPEFVAGLPAKVSELRDRLQHNDLESLQRLAHQLLGTCGGYGFAPVSQPARTLEQSIKEGKSPEFVTPEVKSLMEILRQIDGYDESKEAVAADELAK